RSRSVPFSFDLLKGLASCLGRPNGADERGQRQKTDQQRADETYSALCEQNGECGTEQPHCDAGGKEEHTLRAGAIRRREQFRGPEPVKRLRTDSRRSSPGNGKGQQR